MICLTVVGVAIAVVLLVLGSVFIGYWRLSHPSKGDIKLIYTEITPQAGRTTLEINLFDWNTNNSKTLTVLDYTRADYNINGILGCLDETNHWVLRANDGKGLIHLFEAKEHKLQEIKLISDSELLMESTVVNNGFIIIPSYDADNLILNYYNNDKELVCELPLDERHRLRSGSCSIAVSKRKIAAAVVDPTRTQGTRIHLYDSNGHRLANLGQGSNPRLDANGNRLVYQKRKSDALVVYDTRTKQSRIIETKNARGIRFVEQFLGLADFNITADGRWLIVVYIDTDGVGIGLAAFAVDLSSERPKWYRLPVDLDRGDWRPADI